MCNVASGSLPEHSIATNICIPHCCRVISCLAQQATVCYALPALDMWPLIMRALWPAVLTLQRMAALWGRAWRHSAPGLAGCVESAAVGALYAHQVLTLCPLAHHLLVLVPCPCVTLCLLQSNLSSLLAAGLHELCQRRILCLLLGLTFPQSHVDSSCLPKHCPGLCWR